MALYSVTAGDRILAADVNQFYNILKGVTGSGEATTLIYNAAGALILQPSSNPAAGTELFQIKNAAGTVQSALASSGHFYAADGAVGTPGISFEGDKDTGLYRSATGVIDFALDGVRGLQLSTVASAVNYLDVAPSATTDPLTATAEGTDTDIDINLVPKGSGRLQTAGVDVVTASSTDTLTNKTLTAPTIADFTNANHDHGDADDGGAILGGATIVRKTANESVTSSTTLQDDDDLLFAIGASEIWAFEAVLFYTGATAGDIKIAFTVPASATVLFGAVGLDPSGGSTAGIVNLITAAASGTATSFGYEGSGGDVFLVAKGIVVNSTNAGNVTLQWAQQTSSGTATTVKANSYLTAHKIA